MTAIPCAPYRAGSIDCDAHLKNIRYLMQTNNLSEGRPRVLSIAGTSPIHQMTRAEQVRLVDITTRAMGDEGVYVAGILPSPLADAKDLIGELNTLQRPPDAYLIMPLAGVYDPDGMYNEFMAFGEEMDDRFGARLIYYFKDSRDLSQMGPLFRDSEAFVGVKVGTSEDDVEPLVQAIGDNGLVIWGIGDRCTRASQLGAKGHTSGIAVAYSKASDAINNAQRAGDHAESQRVEDAISALEELRFRVGRRYNYSAVISAMEQSGFDDIDGGEGAPFNPPVPADIAREVKAAIADLAQYHLKSGVSLWLPKPNAVPTRRLSC